MGGITKSSTALASLFCNVENHTSIDRWSSKAYDHEVFGTGSQ